MLFYAILFLALATVSSVMFFRANCDRRQVTFFFAASALSLTSLAFYAGFTSERFHHCRNEGRADCLQVDSALATEAHRYLVKQN
jgi:hypothetical protein